MAPKKKTTSEDIFTQLVNNAFDFLEKALDEFEDRTKYSIIDFYSATELFLKARLMKEHWTLALSGLSEGDNPKNGKNIQQKFTQGDFHSVTLDQSIGRLKNIVGIDLSGPEFSAFDKIRNERNKAVHFYSNNNDAKNSNEYKNQLAKDQLVAWYYLHKLISNDWKEIFIQWQERVVKIEERLITLKKYLLVKFEKIKPELEILKKRKVIITTCPSCSNEAATHPSVSDSPYTTNCLVCGFGKVYIKTRCPSCVQEMLFVDEVRGTCESCGHSVEPEDLIEYLFTENNLDFDYKDPSSFNESINCGFCDGLGMVIITKEGGFFCINCFDQPDNISQCDYCAEYVSGDAQDSCILGCPACDGIAPSG